MSWYFSGGYAEVPRNIMCSKRWANPDLPGSTSFREPVFTGIWTDTIFGNPVGTTMTFSPFGSVFSAALKGRRSREAAAGCFVGAAGGGFFRWRVGAGGGGRHGCHGGEEKRGRGGEEVQAGFSFFSNNLTRSA